MYLFGRSRLMPSKPIERGMTQRVFMAPLHLMTSILVVRIARKDVSTPAENVEALCVGMVREKSLARNAVPVGCSRK